MEKELLKFITCGSVDDGKSTLIGHLLYDAKLIFADQERALELDSKVGATGGQIDYSLLLDGLMAEREQGITIDVAYRYFSTEKRSFIVADTPGHEEYTRNMAVGASFADLAVILVDAEKGVLPQTRRHTRICGLMGIRYFVFAVNKMDLVGYDKKTFDQIRKAIRSLMAEFEYEEVTILPVSATVGDNVTEPSKNMYWYQGRPLLSVLERSNAGSQSRSETDVFTMSVQRVCRPDHTFRGFQGQISTGRLSVGDQICVLPGMQQAGVSELYMTNEKREQVSAGEPVTICLDREIDVSRGDVLIKVSGGNKETQDGAADDQEIAGIHVTDTIDVNLLWMDEQPLVCGRNYHLQLASSLVPVTVTRIHYGVDVNTGEHTQQENAVCNDLVNCRLHTGNPIAVSLFERNKDMGAFIMIDRVTHATSACGTVQKIHSQGSNIFWQELDISREMRENALGQKAKTIWFTGLSGSGKSTIANVLEKKLHAMGCHTMLLDGDNIRMGLCKDLGFTESDRVENIRRIAEVAHLMNEAGLIVLCSFISPIARDRKNARSIIGEDFVEVFVDTPLEECERRDVKGLYKKARAGKIPNFTGISSPFEAPKSPEIHVKTMEEEPSACADRILAFLKQKEESENAR
ncbi:MAG: adenylyl-sulfate kinase [Lachnospiraceae bacterium]|nr:adenylyl-sulfate kinase [Lachnospiraceae bacterium]